MQYYAMRVIEYDGVRPAGQTAWLSQVSSSQVYCLNSSMEPLNYTTQKLYKNRVHMAKHFK